MPLFDAYLTVDWSASSTPKTGENSIWFVLVERDKNCALRLVLLGNSPTRACALHRLGTLLDDLLKRNRRVLAGFDFPFGYPTGTAEALKLKGEPWRAMWSLLAEKIKDDEKNRNNRFDVADRLNCDFGRKLFWARPKAKNYAHLRFLDPEKSSDAYSHKRIEERRLVERCYVSRAQPVWKLFCPGSVGSQTLTGLPIVQKLRRRFEDRCSVWPFETGLKELAVRDLEDHPILLAEIYPSLVEPRSARCDVKDSKQVQAIALHLARLDSCGELAAIFAGPPCLRDGERERAVREEGWILGVTKRKPTAVPVDIDTARPGHD